MAEKKGEVVDEAALLSLYEAENERDDFVERVNELINFMSQ